jgi:hypothetical protein
MRYLVGSEGAHDAVICFGQDRSGCVLDDYLLRCSEKLKHNFDGHGHHLGQTSIGVVARMNHESPAVWGSQQVHYGSCSCGKSLSESEGNIWAWGKLAYRSTAENNAVIPSSKPTTIPLSMRSEKVMRGLGLPAMRNDFIGGHALSLCQRVSKGPR